MKTNKEQLLTTLKKHIAFVQVKLKEQLVLTTELANMDVCKIMRMRPEDQHVNMQIKNNAERRVEELKRLDGSPSL